MKWMVRRISRRASRLVFYCHPHEFVHAHRQSFPRNMSKWNMQGMTPENFSVLDRFVEHMRAGRIFTYACLQTRLVSGCLVA